MGELDNVVELEDGSAIVPEMASSTPTETAFDANLVTVLDDFELNTLSVELLRLIDLDKQARERRDKDYAEGIKRTGLGNEAPGGASFEGASRVVHPVLAEGCVDFSARAIKELFPADGPVKTRLNGKAEEAKLQRAERKRDYLNWQLTTQIKEYRDEKEVLLTQLPLGGSQYEKYWHDPVLKRPCMAFVPIDRVLLPYSANSFYSTPRLTHMQDVTRAEFEERVTSGFYVASVALPLESSVPETSSQEASARVEGKDDPGYNEDGVRLVYEVTLLWELKGDTLSEGQRAAYVMHVDSTSQKMLGIYRNWDPAKTILTEPLAWWVENKFIPWRGAYGIGLLQLVGSLAGALTGGVRAILDAAYVNTVPTAIKLQGTRASGQNVQVDVTEVSEIKAPAGVDDIRKLIMPMPFNPPSAVLFQLIDWLTAQAKGVVATAEEKISEASNQMPVGTAMALIEQGSQVYSSIHARLHTSQAKALEILCRLNRTHPDLESMQRFGVTPADFAENDDIVPVSDPHIFSETQRFAQVQSVLQLASADAPDPSIPWNKVAIRRQLLQRLRVDNIDELLPLPPRPVTADPMSENLAVMHGQPLAANPQQDHVAHLQAHLEFILSPLVAGDPAPDPNVMNLYQHCREHLLFFYQQLTLVGVQEIGRDRVVAMQTQQMTQQGALL